jgi:hypothetical protein
MRAHYIALGLLVSCGAPRNAPSTVTLHALASVDAAAPDQEHAPRRTVTLDYFDATGRAALVVVAIPVL